MIRQMLAAAIVIGLTVGPAPWAAGAVTFHPGAADLGDPLAPGLGNGGYTVSHYRIALNYHPDTGVLVGTTMLNPTLTENLSRFDLDFALPARSVTVNGIPATFRSVNGPEFSYNRDLVVTPAHGLPAGSRVTVVVTYRAGLPT